MVYLGNSKKKISTNYHTKFKSYMNKLNHPIKLREIIKMVSFQFTKIMAPAVCDSLFLSPIIISVEIQLEITKLQTGA